MRLIAKQGTELEGMIGRDNMNKEDYVSLEVAKLLKAKGFGNTLHRYIEKIEGTEKEEWDEDECMYCIKTMVNTYPKPSLYETQKWLRTKKRIHVEVSYMSGDYWLYDILTIPTHDLIGLSDRENVKYMSYEEALNAGILEALKLI